MLQLIGQTRIPEQSVYTHVGTIKMSVFSTSVTCPIHPGDSRFWNCTAFVLYIPDISSASLLSSIGKVGIWSGNGLCASSIGGVQIVYGNRGSQGRGL